MPLRERVDRLMPQARAELAELVALGPVADPGTGDAGEERQVRGARVAGVARGVKDEWPVRFGPAIRGAR